MSANALAAEETLAFPCFGGTCGAYVTGSGRLGEPDEAAEHIRLRLLEWHAGFSRFERASELSRLNADPRETVAVSGTMARFVRAAVRAASDTGGLVDPTLLEPLESAGYRRELGPRLPLELALRLAPARRPAGPSEASRWREITVRGNEVTRPPGVRLDTGGIAKGLFADLLAGELRRHASFAVDCAGDLRIGGAKAIPRPVQVASPFEDAVLHRFEVSSGGVATSGIGRRSWLDDDGRPAHHLLDPSTGRPAYTGIVQATALAPSALQAEILAKTALLGGPEGVRERLPYGGVVVYDDGAHDAFESTLAA